MTKNPYSSAEIGPLMRDVKNKICHQLELLGLLEDDYGMELLVAGNIISLDLSIAQVYELVWRKSNSQSSSSTASTTLLSSNAATPARDCPPMTVTYRLQGLDGEATEPMIKELEEDREETQDPEVEFAIAGVVRECCCLLAGSFRTCPARNHQLARPACLVSDICDLTVATSRNRPALATPPTQHGVGLSSILLAHCLPTLLALPPICSDPFLVGLGPLLN